jgi:hypothetical protein
MSVAERRVSTPTVMVQPGTQLGRYRVEPSAADDGPPPEAERKAVAPPERPAEPSAAGARAEGLLAWLQGLPRVPLIVASGVLGALTGAVVFVATDFGGPNDLEEPSRALMDPGPALVAATVSSRLGPNAARAAVAKADVRAYAAGVPLPSASATPGLLANPAGSESVPSPSVSPGPASPRPKSPASALDEPAAVATAASVQPRVKPATSDPASSVAAPVGTAGFGERE